MTLSTKAREAGRVSAPAEQDIVRTIALALRDWILCTDRATKDVLIEDGLERTLRDMGVGELIAAGQENAAYCRDLREFLMKRFGIEKISEGVDERWDAALAKVKRGGA